MLTQLQRDRVWEAWFAGEVRANYFADLSATYRRRQLISTWIVLLLSSGAFAALVANIPDTYSWVPTTLAALTAAISLWSLQAQNQQRAIDSADLHYRWNVLAAEYRRLWDEMHATDAALRLAALDTQAADLSKAGTALPARSRMLKKWYRHVASHYARPGSGQAAA